MLFVFSFLAVFIKQRSNKAVHQPKSIPYSVQIDQKDSNKIHMYEYLFKGEQFEIFGNFTFHNGQFSVYLDGKKLTTIYQNEENQSSIQFLSKSSKYCEHKVTVFYQFFQILKFSFWPSVYSIRVNFSEMQTIHQSTNKKLNKKVTIIKCSKLWIYGSISNQFDRITFSIDNDHFLIDRKANLKDDGSFFYETKNFDLKNHKITLQTNGSARVYCIYYLSNGAQSKTTEKNHSKIHHADNLLTEKNETKSENDVFRDVIERKSKINKKKFVIIIVSFEIFIFFMILIIVIVSLIKRMYCNNENSTEIPLIILL